MNEADDFSMEVIDLIQQAIADSGFSNAEVIKRTHISQDYFYTRTRGEKPFNTNDISRICNVLDINPMQLMSKAAATVEAKRAEQARTCDHEARIARTKQHLASGIALAAYQDPDKERGMDPFHGSEN